jgi:hypothetical protein
MKKFLLIAVALLVVTPAAHAHTVENALFTCEGELIKHQGRDGKPYFDIVQSWKAEEERDSCYIADGKPLQGRIIQGSLRSTIIMPEHEVCSPNQLSKRLGSAHRNGELSVSVPMTNLLEEAINCSDGDRATEINQDALGIEV